VISNENNHQGIFSVNRNSESSYDIIKNQIQFESKNDDNKKERIIA
jgi:hypothetical protein